MHGSRIFLMDWSGPTHNYSGPLPERGLDFKCGAGITPKTRHLQGLKEMKALARSFGVREQAVLPPHERPALQVLRRLGFTGTDAAVLSAAWKQAPRIAVACSSASAMWTANAATVCPSTDAADGKVHFTPANLVANFHRSIEADQTCRTLRKIFSGEQHFVVHDPLPAHDWFGDEGSANHTRLFGAGTKGLQLFVYGRSVFRKEKPVPQKFPARQTLESCEGMVRRHRLAETQTVLAQQSPEMIDAGIFHNDVIGVGHGDVFFYREQAYSNEKAVIEELQNKFLQLTDRELRVVCVKATEVSTEQAVKF